jgi:hypothetical protein
LKILAKSTLKSHPSHFLVQTYTNKEATGYVHKETKSISELRSLNSFQKRRCNGQNSNCVFANGVPSSYLVRILTVLSSECSLGNSLYITRLQSVFRDISRCSWHRMVTSTDDWIR